MPYVNPNFPRSVAALKERDTQPRRQSPPDNIPQLIAQLIARKPSALLPSIFAAVGPAAMIILILIIYGQFTCAPHCSGN